VLVADGMNVTPLRGLSAGAPDQVSILQYAAERVLVKATLGGNGLLVLADMWYPGWRAYVDGAEQPIYRVYHAFRGVYVPAGSHTVEFVYQPTAIASGAIVSVASLTALLVAVRLATRGRRRIGGAGQLPRRARESTGLRNQEAVLPPAATSSWRQ
jgi:hypothetical protein